MVRSKCPSYVGQSGILLQEFKHVFKIITREDRLKGEGVAPSGSEVSDPRRTRGGGSAGTRTAPQEFGALHLWTVSDFLPSHLVTGAFTGKLVSAGKVW